MTAPDPDPDLIPHATHRHILARLASVEREHNVRILYAAESGSRAWGFASPDSDFDVRFIYAHPLPWYVGLQAERDVIEEPLDTHLVDLAGWDVRKALNLCLKSNPACHEWLVSPIVYLDDGAFRLRTRALFESHADSHALEQHYWSIARTQWRSEIENREAPKLKRYFYVVRPLMALAWLRARSGPLASRLPPMALDELMAGVDVPAEVRVAVSELLAAKRQTPELGTGARIDCIDRWISQRIEADAPGQRAPRDDPSARSVATALFHATVGFKFA